MFADGAQTWLLGRSETEEKMIWKSKEQPIYVFLDDIWQRETDKAWFFPLEEHKCWGSACASAVYWTKRTRVMKTRGNIRREDESTACRKEFARMCAEKEE